MGVGWALKAAICVMMRRRSRAAKLWHRFLPPKHPFARHVDHTWKWRSSLKRRALELKLTHYVSTTPQPGTLFPLPLPSHPSCLLACVYFERHLGSVSTTKASLKSILSCRFWSCKLCLFLMGLNLQWPSAPTTWLFFYEFLSAVVQFVPCRD